MIQYTTPTLHLIVEGADLTEHEVYVTISQGGREVTITDGEVTLDGEDTHIRVPLTQLQTGAMRHGKAKVQVNWTDQSGHRDATTIADVEVTDNLMKRVV